MYIIFFLFITSCVRLTPVAHLYIIGVPPGTHVKPASCLPVPLTSGMYSYLPAIRDHSSSPSHASIIMRPLIARSDCRIAVRHMPLEFNITYEICK